MIEETGVVLVAHGDLAEVECRRQSTCGACGLSGGCGTSLLERYFGRRQQILTVHNTVGAQAGDPVVIGVPEGALLTAAFAAYLAPLITMIGGALLGGWLAGATAMTATNGAELLGGVAGLALGLLWLRRFGRTQGEDPRYRPVILRRAAPLTARVELDPTPAQRP